MTAKVNKSAEVRKYLAENPDIGPSEVARTLKPLDITPNFVCNVKMKMNNPGGKSKTPDYETLIAAAEFINTCGNVSNAKEALEIAEQVVRT